MRIVGNIVDNTIIQKNVICVFAIALLSKPCIRAWIQYVVEQQEIDNFSLVYTVNSNVGMFKIQYCQDILIDLNNTYQIV